MSEKKIVTKRELSEWIMDEHSYVLIRLDKKNKLIEVRVMKVTENQLKGGFSKDADLIADYVAEEPEDLYYKIIKDGHITNLQHAAYLGSELRKAYIALKKGLAYVQDKNLEV